MNPDELPDRWLDRLRRIGDLALALVQTRLALLGSECEALVWRVLGALARGAAALLLLMLGLLFASLWLVLLFWDDHRLLVLGGLTAACLAGGVWLWRSAQRLLRSTGALFALSVEELARDRARLGASPDDGGVPPVPPRPPA
ncbi:putative membrane protein YqjE [Sphaerotilus hippei]|uniref:Putative membrane protein YqjE n=1 Tax=Sphaerotilus hippei TaxID=744406 RepID=A0A318H9D3_9BURK|nr:phage holin family protein [Sphaerotilus hippei]PXW99538.1 putative membrane protein YqjE [Sphaerotilus hippei]